MRSNILFIKTAKCATESIKIHLIKYAHSNSLRINDYHYDDFFYNSSFNINTNHIWYNEETLNHFYNSIDKSLPTLRISSVREPLKRLYSHYCFGHPKFLKGMDFNEWYLKVCKGELQDEWIENEWGDKTNNYMWDYMGLNSLDDLEENYDFIFIKNKFSKCLTEFGKLLDYNFTHVSKRNVNPNSKKDYQFDSEVISLFEERNQKDISLYNKVLKDFNDKY
jgi:hypothetical protein